MERLGVIFEPHHAQGFGSEAMLIERFELAKEIVDIPFRAVDLAAENLGQAMNLVHWKPRTMLSTAVSITVTSGLPSFSNAAA